MDKQDQNIGLKSMSSITPPQPVAPNDGGKVNELSRRVTAQSNRSQDSVALQAAAGNSDSGITYPSGFKLAMITLALCLSVFLMALDNSIIATAIPKISDTFHSLDDIGWYASAYLLTTAALQLIFGKFYTYWDIKLVYLIAIAIFELGSLICGVAQNSVTLIVGRAIAGAGSSGIFSGALLILAYSVPLAKRPAYSGLISSMYGIASVAGPLLGGVFTDKATWRWCFFINLPIGAITIVVIYFFFPSPKQIKPQNEPLIQRVKRFDPIGTIFFMPAVICLLLALQYGGTTYPWNSGRVIALFVLFGLLVTAFGYVQWKQQENATVPPRIIANRSVWASGLYAFATGSAFFIMIYYIPIWFQAVQGVSAVNSGIRNLPMLMAVVIFSISAGGIVTAFGQYVPFMIAGTVLMSVGAGLLSLWLPDTTTGEWIGYQIIFGAGVGLGMQQPIIAVQTALDLEDIPTGTAIIVFLQTLGGALFVSVAQSVFTNKLIESLVTNIPSLDPSTVLAAGATKIQQIISTNLLNAVRLSYNTALTTSFLVSTGLATFTIIGSTFVPWKSVKGKNIEIGMA